MAFKGCAEIKRYLAAHATPQAIESNAHSVKLIEQSTFRRVKLISIDSGRHAFILKTLTPDSVPRQIENEAAAIKYVRARTSNIPTPEVIAYSTTPGNEWIALQHVVGTRLSDAWPTYSEDVKWQFLQTLVDLYKLFSAITSLAAFGATHIGGLNLDMTLGETCEPAKSHGRQSVKGYRPGPYKDVKDYLTSYIDKEIKYYETSDDIDMQVFDYDESDASDEDDDEHHSSPASSFEELSCSSLSKCDDLDDDDYEEVQAFDLSSYVRVPTREEEIQRQKNRDDFIVYLHDLKRFVTSRVNDKELPCLTHNNLHAQNILVNDDQEIVALCNWEFAGFYPLSLTFEAPRMDNEDDGHGTDIDGVDWCEAFTDLFGTVAQVHPLVLSVLEPMNPTLTNAWEE